MLFLRVNLFPERALAYSCRMGGLVVVGEERRVVVASSLWTPAPTTRPKDPRGAIREQDQARIKIPNTRRSRMALLTKLVLLISSVATFSQVLLYLPLALDIAGKDAMLALSLLLCVQSTIQATTHLLTRNTILRPLSTVLTFVQPFVVPALLLLALNLYSKEASITQVLRGESTPVMNAVWKVLIRAPHWWETILRTSSPLFTILEGLSTLLCIQSFSRFSMNRIEKSRAPDMLQVLFLFGAAVVYVCSAYFLYEVSLSLRWRSVFLRRWDWDCKMSRRELLLLILLALHSVV